MGKGFNIASVLRPMLWSIKEEERIIHWICITPNAGVSRKKSIWALNWPFPN
ncbi:23587_t:CDS:1, partial [Gigaspora rosea]